MNALLTAAPAETPLRLRASTCGGWSWFDVVFEGPDADAMAVAYIDRNGLTHVIDGPDDFDPTQWPLTYAALYPVCEHGLSLRLCAGPGHYPDDRH